MSYISPQAMIEPGTFIGHNVTIYGATQIKRGTIIEDNCVIGKPSRLQMGHFRDLLSHADRPLTAHDYDTVIDTPTVIGEEVTLHSGSIIYSGCTLAEGVIFEDQCLLRWDSQIGAQTKLMFGSFIGSYVTIGSYCRIGGFIANRCVVGNYVSSFGSHIHDYTQYGANRVEAAPHVENRVTIGFESLLIGGVTVGEGTYVIAGSTVTRDVPPATIVKGKNEHTPIDQWGGSLAELYNNSFPKEAF